MKTYQKLYYLLSPNERKRGLVVVLLTLLMGIIDSFGAASILPFLALLSNPKVLEENIFLLNLKKLTGIYEYDNFLFFLGICVFILLLFSSISKIISNYALLRFTGLREYSVGKRLLKIYLLQPYAWFLSRNSSDIAKNLLSEINAVIRNGLLALMNLISSLIICFSMIFIMLIFTPKLTISTFSVFLVCYFFFYKISNKFLLKLGKQQISSNRERFDAVNEVFGAIKQVKLSGLEKEYLDRFGKPSLEYASNTSLARIIGFLPRYILEIIAFGGLMLGILFLMRLHGDINYILPSIGLYTYSSYRILPALQILYQSLASIKNATPAIDNLYKDFKRLEIINFHKTKNIKFSFNKSIKLRDIYFKYPDKKKYILENINFKINANEVTGFVGFTGSGKTTLIDLILGLLKPNKGEILIDELPLDENLYPSWQNKIGYVPQNIYLSDKTIASNIAFGFQEEDFDFQRIRQVAKLSLIDSFIENELPNGYNTTVGERGIRLSGGQRQRIGIARALYKSPNLLILDEATSALDNITEKKVINNLYKLNQEMTIIIIAHRLTTVLKCDQIFLLDKGKIVSSGNYNELFSNSKLFREMNNK